MTAKIINITPQNLSSFPPTCFIKQENIGYKKKEAWLTSELKKGLKVKALYMENETKPSGFIEYTNGENAWRAVDAKNYLFIHCIWISPDKNRKKGYGSQLVQEVIKDAEKEGKNGVAVIVSDGPFIAKKDLFLKNGFQLVAQTTMKTDKKITFELLVKGKKGILLPKFQNYEEELKNYSDGLYIIYSNQCPWVNRFINDVRDILKKKNLKAKIIELKSAEEAQKAPSIYGVFNLVYNGELLSDHYISLTRFQNILKKL
jgi:L-amino acid N-acyltransferase YncA